MITELSVTVKRTYNVKVNLAGSTRVYQCSTLADAEALLAVFAKARIIADFD